jgi:hypothetical protein
MPVVSTLGALTYTKTTAELDFGAWALMITTPNVSIVTSFFDTTNQEIYCIASNTLAKISSLINPIVSNVGNIRIAGTGNTAINLNGFTGAAYDAANNSIAYVGSAEGPFPSVFPYRTVFDGTLLQQNVANGVLTFQFQYPRDGSSPSANNQLKKSFSDIAFDSSNNMYIIGSDTLQTGGANFIGEAKLYRYGSPNAISILAETSSNVSSGIELTGKIQLNANDEPIVAYENLNSYARIVLRKIANTVYVNPPLENRQNTLWTVGIKNTANTSIQLTDMKLDANANIFVATAAQGLGTLTGRVTKLSDTGNILWTSGISGINDINLSVKNDNEIYMAGIRNISSVFNIVYAKLDANGNVQWQREIDLQNSFSLENPEINYYDDYLYITAPVSQSTTRYGFATRVPDSGNLSGTFQFPNSFFGGNIIYSNVSYSTVSGGINNWTPSNTTGAEIQTFDSRSNIFTALPISSQKKFI